MPRRCRCLVSFTNTPLESAALAFLPGAFAPADRRATARLLLLLGVASGAVGCAAAVGLPALAPQLFTANAALWEPMQSVALQVYGWGVGWGGGGWVGGWGGGGGRRRDSCGCFSHCGTGGYTCSASVCR